MIERDNLSDESKSTSDFSKRIAALEELAAQKGASITYAGKLLVAVEIGSEVRLYDEHDQFVRLDVAPPMPPRDLPYWGGGSLRFPE